MPCWCHLPLSPHSSIPYPTPMYTHTLPAAIVLPTQAGEPRRFPPPIAAVAQRRKLRVQSLPRRRPGARPALFPFVHFGPSFTQALGLRSARALADTTCFPLSTFPTPPSGAVRPPSGQCLAATTCLPLSTCPARLKPKLCRVAPGRTSRKKRAAQFKSTQFGRPRRPLHPCTALKTAGDRRCAGTGTPRRLL